MWTQANADGSHPGTKEQSEAVSALIKLGVDLLLKETDRIANIGTPCVQRFNSFTGHFVVTKYLAVWRIQPVTSRLYDRSRISRKPLSLPRRRLTQWILIVAMSTFMRRI